ncbi:MAG: single-stranded-DNA-specific exonuclease RecJ [Desulfobulbaceae bacterium]|nr:single-stranded-DNA-specific exonuclease RecJ [Desulfobulbaceae bacterium]
MKIKQRQIFSQVFRKAEELGLSNLACRIVAGRVHDSAGLEKIIRPSLSYLHHPEGLKNCDRAADRLICAISSDERIGIITDYDVDGITSHLVLLESLVFFQVNPERIDHFIGHRLEDGYGISDNLTRRILENNELPGLIVTADCGSSDEENISRLQRAGIDVIVTDHHAIPENGVPSSAYAVINPMQQDCSYPDKTISGCMVSWLLMCLVRNRLIKSGRLGPDILKLTFLLDFVALSTVADAVSLASPANRALINSGLQMMNTLARPCWRAVKRLSGKKRELFSVDDLGFQIGPRINARSRMADPYGAFHFLSAEDDQGADRWLAVLEQDNQERKKIEQEMLQKALIQAEKVAGENATIVVADDTFHAGVQGIVASRLVDLYGRPTVVFSPGRDPEKYSGSARTVDGIHVQQALQFVHTHDSGLMLSFGGHRGAAGMRIRRDRLGEFREIFEQAVRIQAGERKLGPVVMTDGGLDFSEMSLETLAEIENLAPFGREFENPAFEGVFTVERLRPVGADPIHLSLGLSGRGRIFQAIWFRALERAGDPLPFHKGDQVQCVYRLSENKFRGKTTLQLIVQYATRDIS